MAGQSQDKRLAVVMKKQSTLIESNPIPIFKLAQKEKQLHGKMLSKVEIGKPPPKNNAVEHKVLMVVGATGAGKSTLINGMVNYILGVKWEDDFRFKLVVDQGKIQTESVTSEITAYTFHHVEGFRDHIPYSITIIDTPGFGDTKGLKRDKEITQQIKEFFSLPDGKGIDHLDAIGFVTQSALVRLTATQQYIFDSILSIFGKDVAKNIFIMATFCDGQDPPVIDAVKKGNVPCEIYFKFNNSALFVKSSSSKSDSDDEGFDQMFWKMGMKSFKKFFTHFQSAKSVSLTLTREVLENREKLEAAVQGLQRQMDASLAEMEVLRQEELVLQKYEAQIAANKDFSYTIQVPYYETIKLPQGQYVTNCLTCNYTCHYPCGIPDDGEKWRCAAMDSHRSKSAHCRQCKKKCSWDMHKNTGERFELKHKTETRYYDDLKKKYDDAASKKVGADKLIDGHARELEKAYTQLHSLVEETRNCLDILNDIALKPNPLTQVDYIELLIDSEKSQAKPGWQDRVKCLMKAKDQAEWMAKLSVGDDKTGTVAFEDLEQVKRIQKKVEQTKSENKGFFARMSAGTKQIMQGMKTIILGSS